MQAQNNIVLIKKGFPQKADLFKLLQVISNKGRNKFYKKTKNICKLLSIYLYIEACRYDSARNDLLSYNVDLDYFRTPYKKEQEQLR